MRYCGIYILFTNGNLVAIALVQFPYYIQSTDRVLGERGWGQWENASCGFGLI